MLKCPPPRLGTETFTLVDAQLPHLHKYTQTYEEMYPKTTIILVRSFATQWLRRKSYRVRFSASYDPPILARMLIRFT
jgi:hypothetical protein